MWFLNLIRWKNLLIIMVMQGILLAFICATEISPGTLYSTLDRPYISRLLTLWLATLTIAAAGNIMNDIYDRDIDAINKPDANFIGSRISTGMAWAMVFIFIGIGVLAGFVQDTGFGLINSAVALLLWLYSRRLKCIPLAGNIVVALCMGLSVWVVQYAQDFCDPLPLCIYTFFAVLTGFVREMVKDLEDIDGDGKCGCKTLPVAVGVSFAKNLAAAMQFFSTLLVAAGVYSLVRYYPLWHLIYFAAVVILPMFIIFLAITIAKTKKDYSRISTGLKIIMLAGLLYFPLTYYLSR